MRRQGLRGNPALEKGAYARLTKSPGTPKIAEPELRGLEPRNLIVDPARKKAIG